MRCPQALRPGDRVRVVAPSGPFDVDAFVRGVQLLEKHFQVIVPPALVGRRQGFLAGTDDERLLELQEALDDAAARAIWVARGGYGASRIVGRVNWVRFRQTPCWLIGFSDTTTLHLAAQAEGVMTVHGPHVAGLSNLAPSDQAALFTQLANPHQSLMIAGLDCLARPRADTLITGPLAGGNLTVLFAEAAAGRLRLPRGCLLLLEDVTETSYRIDRMLTALAEGGHFDGVKAFLLGEFVDCSAGRHGVPTRDVLLERLAGRGAAVVSGVPVGHGLRNRALLLGAHGHLDVAREELVTTAVQTFV